MKYAASSVGLFFFRPALGGGTTTFAAHMFKAIEAAGFLPTIYRVKEKGEVNERSFGQYEGVMYRNVTTEEARRIVRCMPTVMVAPANSKYLVRPNTITDLLNRGMRYVIHDPNEFQIYDHLSELKMKDLRRAICIRPTIRQFDQFKNALWIPHPYERQFEDEEFWHIPRNKHAVSVARIASVKRPAIILEANRLLPKKYRVELCGAEYRMYTYNLAKKYPDVFKQSGKTFQFPMTFGAPVRLCAEYEFNVDMTKFPNDGGGTQYAQLEAMDAGTVNIMHEDWFRYKGEVKPQKHVLTVDGPRKLADVLMTMRRGDYEYVIENSHALLKRHAPKVIGNLYMEELNK
jgi:hypothetical protein